jgi:hypothetical protein
MFLKGIYKVFSRHLQVFRFHAVLVLDDFGQVCMPGFGKPAMWKDTPRAGETRGKWTTA